MKKLIDFKKLLLPVKDYADKYHEGNFNLAVRVLVREGLSVALRKQGVESE